MKTAKLVLGILSIVFSVMVLFQSCAVSLLESMQDTGGLSGFSGFVVGVLMLVGGIVNITTRNTREGATACGLIFLFAGFTGLAMHGIFVDLQIWGGYCIIVAVVNIISRDMRFK